jgi:hypothetical protein
MGKRINYKEKRAASARARQPPIQTGRQFAEELAQPHSACYSLTARAPGQPTHEQ